MPCESCGVQFSVFRVRRGCVECARWYCVSCLRRGGGMCAPCRLLSARPLHAPDIAHLRVRDLQCFLQRQNVSTRGCVEKEELLNLCVQHVNSAGYRRRARPPPSGAFCALKGLTSNINRLINSAFERPPQPAPPPPPSQHRAPAHSGSDCYNSSHAHARSPTAAHPATPAHPAAPPPPSWREYIPADSARPPSPGSPAGAGLAASSSSESAHVDTADCFEVEDLDDSGWEFVTRPADPLPTDSEVLLDPVAGTPPPPEVPPAPPTVPPVPPEEPPARAASELDLRREPGARADADSASLQDEAFLEVEPELPKRVMLDDVKSAAQLESLSIRKLKELLSDNRVEYRGCLERADLLQRAGALWQDHISHREQLESLPLEECCKICMAAPLECVLLECGHLATCTDCGKRLAECPICRRYVVRAVRVFRS